MNWSKVAESDSSSDQGIKNYGEKLLSQKGGWKTAEFDDKNEMENDSEETD